MKKVILKELTLENFKGIKAFEGDFGEVTDIYGENGTGKTTIADAFFWLLFDKDSEDRTTFDIKPIDSEGNIIHGLESVVIGVLEVDGILTTLRKVYREKWTKRRGEAEQTFTGNETLYFINDLPVKKSEYQDSVHEIIPEDLFKLITNPLFFSAKLKWQERRAILMKILGDIKDAEVIAADGKLRELENLISNTDVDTFKRTVAAKRKRLNEQLKAIPVRIDEAAKSIKQMDFEAIQEERDGLKVKLEDIKVQLENGATAEGKALELKKEMYSLQDKALEIEREEQNRAQEPLAALKEKEKQVEYKLSNLNRQHRNIEMEIPSDEVLDTCKKRIQDYREQWCKKNEEVFEFDTNKAICPTCKRHLDNISQLQKELESNFNNDKAEQLKAISKLGKLAKAMLEENIEKKETLVMEQSALEYEIKELESELVQIKADILNFKPVANLAENNVYMQIRERIQAIEDELSHAKDDGREELKSKAKGLEEQINDLSSQLAYKEQNDSIQRRIEELKQEEREISQLVAQLEKQEFLCEEFVKTKVALLEDKIDKMFKFVSFKMFDTQVNGAIVEQCEPLVDGVPFSSANNASKYNAGLDIINTLCNFYGVTAPILIDNREGINNIIPVGSQVINLRVSQDKELKIC